MTTQRLLHYEIIEKLGEGGMGVVYKARDTHLDRFVAIKVLPQEKVADLSRKMRFVQEAKSASALNHPNIVTIHDIAQEGGHDFIVMEYLAGKTLAQLIGRSGLPINETLKYAIQIADALARVHSVGIIHRDLKPSNLMVDEHGLVKVLDFGLAKLTESVAMDEGVPTQTLRALTEEGAVVGTAAYMSPEQAEGKKVDARSDVFSFGVVLYELVTGRRAFPGESRISVLSSILNSEPKPPRELAPGMPDDLERVIRQCMKKNPSQRFQHMDDVGVELRTIEEQWEQRKLAEEPLTRKARWRWLAAGACGLAGVLAVTGGIRLWHFRTAQPAAEVTFTRLTSDFGLSTQPAISPDGRLVAYASDRSGEGNLDIWVQQAAGGEPIRITADPADDYEPSFSPDGSHLVFRSEREEAGVYVIPALGGDARLIARQGRRPRYSPDGSQIAYWVGKPGMSMAGDSRVFVVPSAGGSPREVQGGLSRALAPGWCPGGKHLLVSGVKRMNEPYDWWVIPLDGGPAAKTGAGEIVPGRGLPGAWIGDRVIYSASSGDSTDLWTIGISVRDWKALGPPRRLTTGTAVQEEASVSASGQVVFASLASNVNIWSLPLEADRGTVRGEFRRLTQGPASKIDISVSPDGSKVAFVEGTRNRGELKIRNLETGKETVLASGSQGPTYPSFSPDGSKVVYSIATNQDRPPELYVVPARGGLAEKICDGCGNVPVFSPDGTMIAYDWELPRRIKLLEIAARQIKTIFEQPKSAVIQPQFCPDGRWVAFSWVIQPTRTRLVVAPFRGAVPVPEAEWISVTDGSAFDIRARWSPNGNLLYFISDRDGFQCIWGQRLVPESKRPAGDPFAVYHMHNPQRPAAAIPDLSMGIARDKLTLNVVERTGNIWIAAFKP